MFDLQAYLQTEELCYSIAGGCNKLFKARDMVPVGAGESELICVACYTEVCDEYGVSSDERKKTLGETLI